MSNQNPDWQEIPDPHAPTLRRLAARWGEQRTNADIPLSIHCRLQDESDLLHWIMLIAVDNQANAYRRYDLKSRFIGDAVAQYFGIDVGQEWRMSEIGPPFADRWFGVGDRVLARRAPCSFHGSPYLTGFDFTHFEMLVLPYSSDASAIDVLLAAFDMSMRRQEP
jgi:hypothetical protein